MGHATSKKNLRNKSLPSNRSLTPASSNGVAIAPPAYGMENIDRTPAETVPAQERAVGAPRQMKKADPSTGGDAPGTRPTNSTGLPDALKSGVESLSGLALDDVRVHYNSPKPAQLQALAYTQGTDIHGAPGQERHLPHEAWHVVQQKQGRVKPTVQMKDVPVNDDAGLEHEANVMGAKALRQTGLSEPGASIHQHSTTSTLHTIQKKSVIQRLVINTGKPELPKEFIKDNGWIVASDLDLAFQEGGYTQRVEELNQVDTKQKVGKSENIYLEGHGSAGKLGAVLPGVVATELNKIIPGDYTGKIRSHSCSAGVGTKSLPSGVEGLASKLDVSGISVEGAGGIALNHSAYARTGGTRAFKEHTIHETKVDDEITRTVDPVNDEWKKYVNLKSKQIGPSNYEEAAKTATTISETFYRNLEHNAQTHLLPESDSLVTSVSSGSSSCFITTACVRARGLPDDCLELTVLRAFRDDYILCMANGKEIIKVYYENAPMIVKTINQRQDALEIYNGLYDVICMCVKDIREGRYENAFQTYVDMVIQLRNRFTPMVKIPAFFYKRFSSIHAD